MRNRTSTNTLLRAYNAARRSGLLDVRPFRRVFLFSYFLYKRWYEDPFWALAKRHPELFAEGDILDVGANIGYTASVFATARKSPSKVYAFEPDVTSFGTLANMIRQKNLAGSVEIFNLAMGSADGMLEFWHNDQHSADHRVVTTKFRSLESEHTNITTVPVTTIDNFAMCHQLRDISFIKIDVQGYELAVCDGMKHTLEKFPQLSIACEYAPDCMRELGFEPSALLDFFRSAGYRLYILTRRAIRLAPDDDSIVSAAQSFGYVDLLCSKRVLGDLPR